MAETPTTEAPVQIEHNIRVVHVVTGEHVICNFGQIREEVDGEQKFVAYQLLYPLTLTLSEAEDETFNVSYRRWNPYTPYEDHRINPTSVISAMPPADDILKNYVLKNYHFFTVLSLLTSTDFNSSHMLTRCVINQLMMSALESY